MNFQWLNFQIRWIPSYGLPVTNSELRVPSYELRITSDEFRYPLPVTGYSLLFISIFQIQPILALFYYYFYSVLSTYIWRILIVN